MNEHIITWYHSCVSNVCMYVIVYRGGTRGGKDQFSWEQVKNAPDKTYYLGSSVKAVAGRWQEGKDVFWYTKAKGGSGQDVEDEIKAVKEREEALMRQALGLHPDDGVHTGSRDEPDRHTRRSHRDEKKYSLDAERKKTKKSKKEKKKKRRRSRERDHRVLQRYPQ